MYAAPWSLCLQIEYLYPNKSYSDIYVRFLFRCPQGKNDNYTHCSSSDIIAMAFQEKVRGDWASLMCLSFIQNAYNEHVNENVNRTGKFRVHINSTFRI